MIHLKLGGIVLKRFLVVILYFCLILTACNEKIQTIPFKENVERITIYDQKQGDKVNEISDPSQISEFLKLMNASKPSGLGDPEPPGRTYEIIFKSGSNSISFYLKKGMTSIADDKIYYKNSKHDAWVPDKSFLRYFP